MPPPRLRGFDKSSTLSERWVRIYYCWRDAPTNFLLPLFGMGLSSVRGGGGVPKSEILEGPAPGGWPVKETNTAA